MKKSILTGILFIGGITFYSCGFYSNILKGMSAQGFVVVLNIQKLSAFEKDISCYYNKFNEFPYDKNKLNQYIDSSQIYKKLFSKLELKNKNINNPKYYFELLPFVTNLLRENKLPVKPINLDFEE